ncbi:hypothetical protein B0H63DRAFT_542165 [Podospora didyma]|uniref:Uncharacterized protein n=1 Tax=Podospora didyma TaxID=330526 RepID=A0AAE0NUN5_9PEZI|nr:hypothetical protein B0H63DRAFT_542165 [Podospora didyma]
MSPSQARALVGQLANDHGHLREEYSQMSPEIRRRVEEALFEKDEIIGSSVITLAKNLCSKDTRFIFELLQNVDDNLFKTVSQLGQDPQVSFCVFNDRIVVEYNEDGFSQENLRAICNIGKSSKTGSQGYIGERGIGFKSIFKHRPGDSGMGMISPEWEEPAEQLDAPLTRMTFWLHDNVDAPARVEQLKTIEGQLNDLQPAMLLFLKQLNRVYVRLFDIAGTETLSSTLSLLPGEAPNRDIVERVRTSGGREESRTRQVYHVTRKRLNGFERSETRECPEREDADTADTIADVVLAFPLSDKSEPIIEPQDIFAFLPVRQVGFTFLIHTNFVTLANREDIVTTSPRNKSLRHGLAITFRSAVKQMCGDPVLRYKWMRYLPAPSRPWEEFWKSFVITLEGIMRDANVLEAMASNSLRFMKQLRIVHHIALDGEGNHLFADLEEGQEFYLSKRYEPKDMKILWAYKMEGLSMFEVIARVRNDLRNESTSRMKSQYTQDDWHSRAAKLLCKPFETSWPGPIDEIKGLQIVPLSDGRWVTANPGQLYFPTTTEGISYIPAALNLNLVCANAASNPERRRLFFFPGRCGGVKRFHSVPDSPAVPFHLALERDQFGHFSVILAISLPSTLRSRVEHKDVYIADESPYGPSKPGLAVLFAHYDYFTFAAGPEMPGEEDSQRISWEFRHVAISQPAQVMGLLKSLWSVEGHNVLSNDGLRQEVMELDVICQGGSYQSLQHTVLPLLYLKQIASRFLEPDEFFPFLELETPIDDYELSGSWRFLDKFNVKRTDDLSFYLSLLKAIVLPSITSGPRQHIGVARASRVWDPYVNIQLKYVSSADRDESRDPEWGPTILIPKPPSQSPVWCIPRACLLGAPQDIASHQPVDSIYQHIFPDMPDQVNTVMQFLSETLRVQRCSWQHLLEDLRVTKQNSLPHQRVKERYQNLYSKRPLAEADKEAIRDIIEAEALILVQINGESLWLPPSQWIDFHTLRPFSRGQV